MKSKLKNRLTRKKKNAIDQAITCFPNKQNQPSPIFASR